TEHDPRSRIDRHHAPSGKAAHASQQPPEEIDVVPGLLLRRVEIDQKEPPIPDLSHPAPIGGGFVGIGWRGAGEDAIGNVADTVSLPGPGVWDLRTRENYQTQDDDDPKLERADPSLWAGDVVAH